MTSFLDMFIAAFVLALGMTLGCFLGAAIVMIIADKFDGFLPWF